MTNAVLARLSYGIFSTGNMRKMTWYNHEAIGLYSAEDIHVNGSCVVRTYRHRLVGGSSWLENFQDPQ